MEGQNDVVASTRARKSGQAPKRRDEIADLVAHARKTYADVVASTHALLGGADSGASSGGSALDTTVAKAVMATSRGADGAPLADIVGAIDMWDHYIVEPAELAAAVARLAEARVITLRLNVVHPSAALKKHAPRLKDGRLSFRASDDSKWRKAIVPVPK